MGKSFWAILSLVVIALIAVFILAGGKAEDADNPLAYSDNPTSIQDHDHIQGDNTDVVIIEYGDFQCPACAAFFPIVQETKTRFGDEFQLVFRHLPLVSIHPQALVAARAVEAAGMQGKFFEMHDIVYLRQASWSGSDDAASLFEGYARELELDIDQYNADVVSDEVFNKIDADANAARSQGFTGTPTIVVNGERIPTPASADQFKAIIDAANEAPDF